MLINNKSRRINMHLQLFCPADTNEEKLFLTLLIGNNEREQDVQTAKDMIQFANGNFSEEEGCLMIEISKDDFKKHELYENINSLIGRMEEAKEGRADDILPGTNVKMTLELAEFQDKCAHSSRQQLS